MKISIVAGPLFAVPPINGGAMQRIWQGLAEHFAARGHEVTMLARTHPDQPKTEMINGVSYRRHGGFDQAVSTGQNLVRDAIYAIDMLPRLPEADICVINDFTLPMLASRFRRKAGLIVTSANRYPKGQYKYYRKVNSIVPCSRAVAEAILEQSPGRANQVTVIGNPVETAAFSPQDPPACDRSVVFVGRLHPEKGVGLLIEAVKQMEPEERPRLTIVGPHAEAQGGGGESYLRRLQTQAADLDCSFIGPCFDVNELAQHYRDSTLMCYPSIAETGEAFGIVPVEAMAAGTVPVVSDLLCFSEYLIPGETGFQFDHRGETGATHLAETFTNAFANPERLQQVRQKALKMSQNFTYTKIGDQFLAHFEALLAERRT